MNPKLRAFLEANGLRKNASDAEAWAHYDKLQADGIELPGIDPGTRSAVGETAPEPETADQGADDVTAARGEEPIPPADLEAFARQAVIADRQRCDAIDERLLQAGLFDEDNGEFRRSLVNDPHCTVDMAARQILDRMSSRSPAIGVGAYGAVGVGVEERDKFRDAALDGLAQRSGLTVESPAAGAREFRGRPLWDICRESLTRAGINVRGMGRRQFVGRGLAAGSATDFPLIMSALVGRHLLAAYAEWPQTFRPFVAVVDANDFKDIHALRLSESPDLEVLNEHGEYKEAFFDEAGESYRVITKGKVTALTRVMIINDDLRAFTRIPALFGSAARRMEGDMVYGLINANGTLSDGQPLFHADHKNLAAAGGAPDSATLQAARAAMRKQKGMKGAAIDVLPAFLLTNVDNELDAEILLRSASLPDDNKSAGVHNPWAGKLTPIADPRVAGTAWYLLAHPNQYPSIEVAYLEGEEQPYIDEELDFDSDALKIKVRHDFGAGVVDHVGIYKNPGA